MKGGRSAERVELMKSSELPNYRWGERKRKRKKSYRCEVEIDKQEKSWRRWAHECTCEKERA